MANALLRLDDAAAAADLLEQMLPLDASVPLEHRRAILFMRGKALLESGRLEDAYTAYREANETVAGRWAGQRDLEAAHQQELIRLLDRPALDSLPRPDIDASNIVLIVGLPRCGSTLTEQIIDAHPDAYGVGESLCMPELVNTMHERFGLSAPWPACRGELTADQLGELARFYIDFISYCKRYFITRF